MCNKPISNLNETPNVENELSFPYNNVLRLRESLWVHDSGS